MPIRTASVASSSLIRQTSSCQSLLHSSSRFRDQDLLGCHDSEVKLIAVAQRDCLDQPRRCHPGSERTIAALRRACCDSPRAGRSRTRRPRSQDKAWFSSSVSFAGRPRSAAMPVPLVVSRGACCACSVSVGVPRTIPVRAADGPQFAAYRLRTRASVERCLNPVVKNLVLELDRSVAVAKAAQGSSPRQLHASRGLRNSGVSKIMCEVPDLGLQLLRQFPRCFDYLIEYLHVSPRVC